MSNASCSRPSGLCPPAICRTGSLPMTAPSPARLNTSASKPMSTSAGRPPTPSTTAFVASVVDRVTREMALTSPSHAASTASIALPTPTDRSARVVNALAVARTLRLCLSTKAASVNVPPVSSPRIRLMWPIYGAGWLW